MLVDLRPDSVDLLLRPGVTYVLTLPWPAGELTGRTFTSSLGGTALDVTIAGDTMTIEATDTITGDLDVGVPVQWLLLEDIDGTDEPILVGTWTPSNSPRAVSSSTVVVAVAGSTIQVTVNSSQGSIAALDGRLDTAETDITALEAADTALDTRVDTLETGKVDVAGDTMTGPLVVEGSVTVGAVELTGTDGAPDILTVGGAINTFHDFFLIPATHMVTDGTPPAVGAACPRAILAAGDGVAWAREVPAGWGQISLNLLFTKEIAASGNVHWSLAYQLVDFLTGEALNGAMTTLDLGGVSVPTTVLASKYYIPPTSQAIATPPQPFGLPPLIRVTLTRIDDATDTYGDANGIGLVAMSMSRTS